jgi:predicted kinase
MKYFTNKNKPTMTELVHFLQIEFRDLCNDLKNSNHAYSDFHTNSYHLEDSVWTHTMMASLIADREGANKINLISILLHDLGKPLAEEKIAEDEKTRFIGHEGISFYKSIEVLYKLKDLGVLNIEEIKEVLAIISLHGTLFSYVKEGREHNSKKLANEWSNCSYFDNYVSQVRYDSLGRFFLTGHYEKEHSDKLGLSLFGKEWKEEFKHILNKEVPTIKEDKPTLTFLIGVQNSGKSTWIKDNVDIENTIILSFDNILLKIGNEFYGNKTYNEYYYLMIENEDFKKSIDTSLHETYINAVRAKKDIVIDMMSLTPKSRRRYGHSIRKKYNVKIHVFVTSWTELFRRNLIRNESTNKSIREATIIKSMKKFIFPKNNEADTIEFIFND